MGQIVVLCLVSRTSRKRHPTTKQFGVNWVDKGVRESTYGAPCVYTRSKQPESESTSFTEIRYMLVRRTSSEKVIIWSQHKTVKLAIATNLKCEYIRW